MGSMHEGEGSAEFKRTFHRLRLLWIAELRRRGLSSELRISSMARNKALRGVLPRTVR